MFALACWLAYSIAELDQLADLAVGRVIDCSGALDLHLANGAVVHQSSPALVGVVVGVGIAALVGNGIASLASLGSGCVVGLFVIAGCCTDGRWIRGGASAQSPMVTS